MHPFSKRQKGMSWRVLLILIVGVHHAAWAGPHYVFAHYMLCYADYGPTVGGFEKDIQDAQAAGVDGFALDVAAWSGPNAWYYQAWTELMFDAAESLGSGFKLFFSVEMTNTTDIATMVESYANRSNYFRYNGKLVLSTYGQNQVDWANAVFPPLASNGIPVFFVPYFYPEPIAHAMDYSAATNLLTVHSNILDGLFYWAAGTAQTVTNVNNGYGQACKDFGKVYMAGYSPNYWGCNQVNRSYIENDGGEGTAAEWLDIIQLQPDWVEMTTWNDWGESTYLSPISDPGIYFTNVEVPFRYSHAGFLQLSKYYITWYKTGQPPPINQTAVFYFYRTHSTNAVAANDIPVTVFRGDVADTLYATVFVNAPAQLEIISGTNSSTNAVGPGITHVRMPFAPGAQTFTVRKNGYALVSATGPNILSQIQVYDYFQASGYAYGASGSLSPPTDLRVVNP
jgi:glucan endo-1,3-alpha-glucosidase